LNRSGTAALVDELGVIALRADKTRDAPEVDELLVELGNPGLGIPYVAIFPGDGSEPITIDGVITQAKIMELLKQAGPSRNVAAGRTAMNAR